MIKVKITPSRFAEVTNVLEYLSITGGNKEFAMRVIPRFIVDENDEYVVKAVIDADGDIEKLEGEPEAIARLTAMTPKRLERLTVELMEAAKAIVNPPNGGA